MAPLQGEQSRARHSGLDPEELASFASGMWRPLGTELLPCSEDLRNGEMLYRPKEGQREMGTSFCSVRPKLPLVPPSISLLGPRRPGLIKASLLTGGSPGCLGTGWLFQEDWCLHCWVPGYRGRTRTTTVSSASGRPGAASTPPSATWLSTGVSVPQKN